MSEEDLTTIRFVGPKKAEELREAGFGTVEDVMNASVEELSAIDGLGRRTAEDILGIEPLEDFGKPERFEEVREDLLEGAGFDVPEETIANYAGISRSSLHVYKDKYPEFEREFRQRRAKTAVSLSEDVKDPANKEVQRSLQFLLERSHGFMKTERQEVEMETDNTHRIEGEGFVVNFGSE